MSTSPVGFAPLCGAVAVTAGLEARTVRGVQAGLFNIASQVNGVQVGLVNRAGTAYGFQVGGVNVIRDSDLAFCPILNIGFDLFPNY